MSIINQGNKSFISLKSFSYSLDISNLNYSISKLTLMGTSLYLTDLYIKPYIKDIFNRNLLNNIIKRNSHTEFIKTVDLKKIYNNYVHFELIHTDIQTIVFVNNSTLSCVELNKVSIWFEAIMDKVSISFKSLLKDFYNTMAGNNRIKQINNYSKPFSHNIRSTPSLYILNGTLNLSNNNEILSA